MDGAIWMELYQKGGELHASSRCYKACLRRHRDRAVQRTGMALLDNRAVQRTGMALLDNRAVQRTGMALLDNRADQRTGMAFLDNRAVQRTGMAQTSFASPQEEPLGWLRFIAG